MDTSDIAALSIAMHTTQLQASVGISVAKKAMDSQEQTAAQLLEMLPQTAGLGAILDVKA